MIAAPHDPNAIEIVTRTRNIQSIESVLLLDENNLLMDLFIIDRSSYLCWGTTTMPTRSPFPFLPLVDQKKFLCIAVRYLFVVVVDVFGVLNEIPLVG